MKWYVTISLNDREGVLSEGTTLTIGGRHIVLMHPYRHQGYRTSVSRLRSVDVRPTSL